MPARLAAYLTPTPRCIHHVAPLLPSSVRELLAAAAPRGAGGADADESHGDADANDTVHTSTGGGSATAGAAAAASPVASDGEADDNEDSDDEHAPPHPVHPTPTGTGSGSGSGGSGNGSSTATGSGDAGGAAAPRRPVRPLSFLHAVPIPTLRPRPATVYPAQEEVARVAFNAMVEAIKQARARKGKEAGTPAPPFTSFDFFVVMPSKVSLLRQTLRRVAAFVDTERATNPDFLPHLGTGASGGGGGTTHDATRLHACVAKLSSGGPDAARFRRFIARVIAEPTTLFLLVHDEAHHSASFGGKAHQFVNDPAIRLAPNVVTLSVSATPYNLVTAGSQIPAAKGRIPAANEVHWDECVAVVAAAASGNGGGPAPGSYYGVQEYRTGRSCLRTTRRGAQQQATVPR